MDSHYAVVTLVQDASIYLWDLDDDHPYCTVSQLAPGLQLRTGSIVRVTMRDGRPERLSAAEAGQLDRGHRHVLSLVMGEGVGAA